MKFVSRWGQQHIHNLMGGAEWNYTQFVNLNEFCIMLKKKLQIIYLSDPDSSKVQQGGKYTWNPFALSYTFAQNCSPLLLLKIMYHK